MKYKATLTGEPIMIRETVLIAKYVIKGSSLDKNLLNKLEDENTFQYKTLKSYPKRFNAIKKRLEALDPSLIQYISNSSAKIPELIIAWSIIKTQPIVKDFFYLFISEKFNKKDLSLSIKDVSFFIGERMKVISEIEGWTEFTQKKINLQLRRIIEEIGILKDSTLSKIMLDKESKGVLTSLDSEIDTFLKIVTY